MAFSSSSPASLSNTWIMPASRNPSLDLLRINLSTHNGNLLVSWPPLRACHKTVTMDGTSSEHVDSRQQVSSTKTETLVKKCTAAILNDIFDMSQLVDENTSFVTLASFMKHCGKAKALSDGRRVHAHMKGYNLDRNTFLGNCLIEMYGNCGSVKDSRIVFDSIPNLNLYSWNILINAYAKNGHSKEALDLFHQMQLHGCDPDPCTFVCVLSACTCVEMLAEARNVHAAIINTGCTGELVVENSLIGTYGRCGSLCDATNVFDRIMPRNVVSWNAIIAACAQGGHSKEALDFFQQMRVCGFQPNHFSFVSALDACASLAALKEGQHIHALIVSSGCVRQVIVATALVNLYGKCGSIDDSRNAFSQIQQWDVVSWNAMIAACVDNGHGKMALQIFHEMQSNGFKPNQVTFVCALDACAILVVLEEGLEIHAAIVDKGYDGNLPIGTALVNMYGKCGNFCDAKSVFDEMPQQDLVSWSAMIAAYAQNGHCKEALYLFHQMQLNGIKPDHATFLSILTACNHAGRVDDGKHHFFSVSEQYGIEHTLEHYMCMIDLLGRAGHLADAENLIHSMPLERDATVWLCLLAACKIHGDVVRGIRAANHIFALDPSKTEPYIMLSNIFAAAEMGSDAQEWIQITED